MSTTVPSLCIAIGLSLVTTGWAGEPLPGKPLPTRPSAVMRGHPLGSVHDPLSPYDAPPPRLHGYFQEFPAFGGYYHFRPYDYRHVFSQSRKAAAWGLPPQRPYSHDLWRKREALSRERD